MAIFQVQKIKINKDINFTVGCEDHQTIKLFPHQFFSDTVLIITIIMSVVGLFLQHIIMYHIV